MGALGDIWVHTMNQYLNWMALFDFSHIGKPHVYNVLHPRTMWVGVVMCTYEHDELLNYHISSKQPYWEPAFIVRLYYACNYTVAISPARCYSQLSSIAHRKACFNSMHGNTAKHHSFTSAGFTVQHCKASRGKAICSPTYSVMVSRLFFSSWCVGCSKKL